MGRSREILLGVCGGIAAYKIPDLVRLLRKKGLAVRVAMTKSAELFVTPTTLHTVSGNRVFTAHWDSEGDPLDHINAARGPELALIAPATANFLGKMAGGIADDFLSTLVLALKCPVYVAPSMNPAMYQNPAVQENIGILKGRGIGIIEPETGDTACGEEGQGRLPEPETLAEFVEKELGLNLDLAGKKILVTAGRTEEPIDTVRFISNRSSGKMGIAIAEAARERGADVTLIHGAVSRPLPENTKNIEAKSAREMHEAVEKEFSECDVLIMAAAVADFRPARLIDAKIKKDEGLPAISLTPTPDILENLGRIKKGRILVGFAAETRNIIANARQKLLKKNLDMICVNDVSRSDIGFDSDYNEVTFIRRTGAGQADDAKPSGRLPKTILAHRILDETAKLLQAESRRVSGGDG
ncbi:MAG: bifunctional phosphopantothenoylcysteine decarboxylase/phosphopantothenate--cysteine ligase CoaBC [Nitrospinota bacterium]